MWERVSCLRVCCLKYLYDLLNSLLLLVCDALISDLLTLTSQTPPKTRHLLCATASFASLGVFLFFEYHHKSPVLPLCTNQSIKRILGLFLSTMHNFSLMTYTWFWGYFILINVVEINGANVNVESTIKPIEVHIINQLLINHTKTALQQSYTLKG